MDGLEDGTPGAFSTAERLQAVYRRREAWRSLDFSFKRIMVVPETGSHSYVGSHFAWVDTRGTQNVLQLPSKHNGVPEKTSAMRVDLGSALVLETHLERKVDLLVLLTMFVV